MTPASRRTAHLRMGGRLIMIAGIYIAGHAHAPAVAIPITATYVTGAWIWDVLTDRQVAQLETKAAHLDKVRGHWKTERAARLAADRRAIRAETVRDQGRGPAERRRSRRCGPAARRTT